MRHIRGGKAGIRGRFTRRQRNHAARGAAGTASTRTDSTAGQMDWPRLMDRLRFARHRWDLAIASNLDEEKGRRPADLLAAINSQSAKRQLSPQVLSARLRSMESDGYVRHADLTRIPLVRVYYLLPQGRAMLRMLRSLEPWDEHMPDRRSHASTGCR